MQTTEFTRKPFHVEAVEITLQNAEDVAEWCKGVVEEIPYKLIGMTTDLPCVKVPGSGVQKGKLITALLGYWVVKHKESFRVYKPSVFKGTFDLKPRANVCSESDWSKQEGELAGELQRHIYPPDSFPKDDLFVEPTDV